MALKPLTDEQMTEMEDLLDRAQKAADIIATYDQERVDHLIRAVGWAITNLKTWEPLAYEAVDETGLGDPISKISKRNKVRGMLRDALREKSVGIIEQCPEKGIVKYAKPVGVIVSLVPTTNPGATPAGQAMYSIKARNAMIFCPHPRAKKLTNKVVDIMRAALEREGAPADILLCVKEPSLSKTDMLMKHANLVIATGGKAMVEAAYSSGTPAFGSGAGNSTMIIDETADLSEAAMNTRISKTSDFGSGCSCDGNLIIHESVWTDMIQSLVNEGGYLASPEESTLLKKVMWDKNCNRTVDTVAISPQALASKAGFVIDEKYKFIMVMGEGIGKEHLFSSEKLTTLLALFKYEGEFENALNMMREIYEVGGKGHSCGIYSFNEDHIHRLGMAAPVSRIMVRQPQNKANAGSYTNGMPMTNSMGCGTWGGNVTSENIALRQYMNVTWVSVPIPEDKPSDEWLFGEFYNPNMDK